MREIHKRIWGSIEDFWNALPDGALMIEKLASSFGCILLSHAVGEGGLNLQRDQQRFSHQGVDLWHCTTNR